MRDILFKAKRLDNGEWMEGYYVRYGFTEQEKCYIMPYYASALYSTEIDPSTVCQYTGLTDKNERKIWENDIVKRNFRLYSSETKYEERENKGIVKYDSGFARFGYQCSVFSMLGRSKKHDTLEVIGNIFDTPELLEAIYDKRK